MVTGAQRQRGRGPENLKEKETVSESEIKEMIQTDQDREAGSKTDTGRQKGRLAGTYASGQWAGTQGGTQADRDRQPSNGCL